MRRSLSSSHTACITLFLVTVVSLQPLSLLHADGGTVRVSERRGTYRITVFTSPTPPRVGPVDVSVFVQDAATGEPVPGLAITVTTHHVHPEMIIYQDATVAEATNKLFQAAVFDLPDSGRWDFTIGLEAAGTPIEVPFGLEVEEALPQMWEVIPWIVWPAGVIFLFFVHQFLAQRKSRGSSAIKRPASP